MTWEEPDYLATTPQRAHAYIYNEAGLSRQEADEHVAQMAKAAKDAVEKHKKKAPKMGRFVTKYNAEKAAWAKTGEELQREVDFWEAVKAEQKKIRAAEKAAAERAESREGGDSAEETLVPVQGSQGVRVEFESKPEERAEEPAEKQAEKPAEEAEEGQNQPSDSVLQPEKQEFDRTVPSTQQQRQSAIARILDLALRIKDRVERAVIAGITNRQKSDLKKHGIAVDDSWVHSLETSAIIHNQKQHGDEAIEAARGQIAIKPEDYSRIPEILENYDSVSKSSNRTKSTDNEVIIYEKEFDDGYVYYLEEVRSGRKSLAFHNLYKKKRRADSSGGLVPEAPTSTSMTAPDNLGSPAGKGSENSADGKEPRSAGEIRADFNKEHAKLVQELQNDPEYKDTPLREIQKIAAKILRQKDGRLYKELLDALSFYDPKALEEYNKELQEYNIESNFGRLLQLVERAQERHALQEELAEGRKALANHKPLGRYDSSDLEDNALYKEAVNKLLDRAHRQAAKVLGVEYTTMQALQEAYEKAPTQAKAEVDKINKELVQAQRRVAELIENIARAEEKLAEDAQIESTAYPNFYIAFSKAKKQLKKDYLELERLTGEKYLNDDGQGESEATEPSKGITDIKPSGTGPFGEIFTQFKGKAREAASLLWRKRSGEVRDVFNRTDIGGISLIWGDEKKGLAHLIKKHIIEQSDFDSVAAMLETVQEVIDNGEATPQKNGNIKIEKDGYRVVIAKTKDGGFILTAFDKTRKTGEKKRSDADASNLYQSVQKEMDGNLVPSGNAPADKGSEKTPNGKEPRESRAKEKQISFNPKTKKWAGLPYKVISSSIPDRNGTVTGFPDNDNDIVSIDFFYNSTLNESFARVFVRDPNHESERELVEALEGKGFEVDNWGGISYIKANTYPQALRYVKLIEETAAEIEAVRRERRANKEETRQVPTFPLSDCIRTLFEKGKRVASRLYQRSFFNVAKTTTLLKNIGLTGERFTISYGVISRHFGKDADHNLPVEVWEQLPDALQTPFAVTKYYVDAEHTKQRGYRLYTTIAIDDGHVVVGVDVKNVGRDLEVNSISTVFSRQSKGLSAFEEEIYRDKKITPEQASLLDRPNSGQYPSAQEQSIGKGSEKSADGKEPRESRAEGEAQTPSEQEAELRDTLTDIMRDSGIEVSTDAAEGQRILDEYNGQARLMGSRVERRMADFGKSLQGRELSSQQQAVVDVFSGKEGNTKFRSADGRTLQMRQGNELNAGTKHSLFRHYGTSEGIVTTEDILRIPFIFENGSRREINKDGRRLIEYSFTDPDTGTRYTLLTERKGGREVFNDFYTNRKASLPGMQNTQRSAQTDSKDAKFPTPASSRNDAEVATNTPDGARSNREENSDANLGNNLDASNSPLREHRVYSGSGSDFDAFDHSHMGEGEGAQAYGWGTYTTDSRGKARPYARGYLYEVEIPDDTGGNYLHWEKSVNRETRQRIVDKLFDTLTRPGADYEGAERELREELNSAFAEGTTGSDFYGNISAYLGGDKEASEFLHSLGYAGIRYEDKGTRNYVIFNEADTKITDKIRFFRTAGGEAYGFTMNGKIYLDPRLANAETPIHEYSHLWAEALRKGNAKEWENVVKLMRDTDLWEEVKRLYPELKTDDEIADEVLAHYSGRRGAERLREEAKRIAESKATVLEKAEKISAIQRVKEALNRFWKGVADFLHIHYTSAEEVADRVLRDMLEGVNPLERVNAKRADAKSEGVRFSKAEEERIVERAKAEGTYMKAPNGKDTKLTQKQWVQVRTRAFKNWFGDWEKAARANAIRLLKAIKVNKLPEGKTYEEVYKSLPDGENVNDGLKVKFFNSAYKKIVRSGGLSERVIPSLSEIFNYSVLAYSETENQAGEVRPDGTKHKEHRNITEIRNYIGKAEIDGKEYYVRFTVFMQPEQAGTHSYFVTDVSVYDKATESASASGLPGTRLAPNGVVDAKLQEFFETAKNCSKVIDENGEPLVVYHGRSSQFNVFTRKKGLRSKYGVEYEVESEGYFFSPNKEFAERFAKNSSNLRGGRQNVIECFLNLRSPLDLAYAEDKYEIYEELSGEEKEEIFSDRFWRLMDYQGISEKLKEKGYDGAIFAEEVEDYTFEPTEISYCIFDSNQIKSATENVGTFDARSSDIRFREGSLYDANGRLISANAREAARRSH